MRLRPDVVIFAVLLAGSAYAVSTQLHDAPDAPYAGGRAAMGSVVADFTLKDIGLRDRTLAELSKGAKATVLYFWSVECPCVDAREPRMKEIVAKYEKAGVAFVGIDSDPNDTRDQVFEKMGRIRATAYRMLLDPTQAVLKATGGRTATEAIVLDDRGRIRYRGAFDDDLLKPTRSFLGEALDALLAGRDPSSAETPPDGCPFPGFEGECAFVK